MDIDALRAAMQAAQPDGKGTYIEHGRHALETTKCFVKYSNQDGHVKTSWIFETKVLASTNPTHEVGSTRSYVENPENKGWMGRVKAFLIAAAGIGSGVKLTPDQETLIGNLTVALAHDETRIKWGWPENFLAKKFLFCEGMPGQSTVKKMPVTNKKWEPLTPELYALAQGQAPAGPAAPAAPAGAGA